MKKILLLTSHFSEQDSVTSITKNIILGYKQLTNVKVKILAIEDYSTLKNKKLTYDFIIIVHPYVMLANELKSIITLPSLKEITFIFYVFGDLVRKSGQLINLEESLLDKKVHFITASHSYKSMMKKCIKNSKEVSLVPFPLNQKTFYYNLPARMKFRKEHKLVPTDKALIYTGRLSSQKNIDYLIKTYSQVKSKYKSVKLFIYGNIDEFDAPTFYERKYAPGDYFNQLKKALSEIPANDIVFSPRVNHKKLNEAYNGCDLFVSLSLYHDEDFGYSPLEALCSGTPVWVTSWGGYRDLNIDKKSLNTVNYVKVNFKEDGLEIDDNNCESSLLNALKKAKRSSQTSKSYRRHYSIETISASYSKTLSRKTTIFTGFTPEFVNLSLSMYMNQKVDLKLYQNFYQSFWKN